MTSTTTAASAANGTSGNNTTASTQSNTSGRPATKATSTMKGSDTSRKQSGSPVDGGQRRSNSQKAWTQGTNPITQRASYTQQNGSTSHPKTMSSPKYSGPKETNTPDKHANDRLISLLSSCIGLMAVITVKNGDKYSGIFSSSSLEPNDSSFILKMVQKTHSEEAQANGVAEHEIIFVGSGKDHAMAFDVKDVVELSVENVSSTETASKNQNGASFRTDAEISGNLNMRERKLEPWLPPPDSNTNLSLDEGNLGWDQFAENEKRFGVKSDYDENYYTTAINRSGPGYRRKEAEAARKAAEIEGSAVTNSHMREERGLAFEHDGQDEEDKYSGVRRDDTNFPPLQSGQPNKYTPPARRAPTGQPTVYGAPVDPAIISAQMARPDTYPKPTQMKNAVASKPSAATENASIASEAPSTQLENNVQTQAADAPPEKLTVTDDSAPKSSTISTSMSPRRKLAGENATATVETDVVEAFKEFANKEKLKVEQNRRDKRSQDKAVKLNDLMSFSKNFKLHTPVPVDLIPILAKDKAKQEKIVEKAQREHDEATANTPPKTTPVTEQKPLRPTGPGRYDVGPAPPSAPADRQNYPRGRQAYPPSGPQNSPGGRMDRTMQGQNATIHSGRGNGSLSHRLMDIRQQQKAGAPLAIPAPLPLHENRVPPTGPMVDQSGLSSPQRSSAIHTPTSTISTKFNVKALEFKPNPAASAFTPASTSNVSSSPRSNARTRSVSRAASPSAFFGTKKPLPASERPSIANQFNPIKRMKKEIEELKAVRDGPQTALPDYSANGGIPQSFRTPPTWDVPKENQDKTYAEMFDQSIRPPPSVSPQARAASNPTLPHQHQLPLHLQHGAQHVSQAPAPHQAPHHLHPQQQHFSASPHHFEDQQRMHLSASSSSMFPSPRMQHNAMAYSSPMNTHAQLVYGQPPPAQAFMGQGGPQSGHMRPYGGAAAFVGQQNTHMVAPMMVQQQSNGPFIAMPQGMPGMALPPNYQMGMYSPNPGHVYPQQGGPQQPHSGYPSPSRGAPMMMHQGSQQGHYPQQMMHMNPNQHGQGVYASPQPNHVPMRGYQQQQPQFSSSPHQPHHFPPQSHRVASNTYGAHMQQMPQMPAHMVSQQPPHPGAPMPLAPEGVEEVK